MISGRTPEKAWRVFSMQPTQVSLILSQDHPRYFTEKIILTTCNETVDEPNTAILPSVLGWPTPLQAMTGYPWELRKHKYTILRMSVQSIPADSNTKLLSKDKTGTQSGMPSHATAQPESFPRPLWWNRATDYSHLHTSPWGMHFGRWAWWKATVHPLHHPILT